MRTDTTRKERETMEPQNDTHLPPNPTKPTTGSNGCFRVPNKQITACRNHPTTEGTERCGSPTTIYTHEADDEDERDFAPLSISQLLASLSASASALGSVTGRLPRRVAKGMSITLSHSDHDTQRHAWDHV